MQSGVYIITNTTSKKFYVGSSVDCRGRWIGHQRLLNKGRHPNLHLQAAWNKYGYECFVFSVIEFCDHAHLIGREQHWIDALRAVEFGYNIAKNARKSALGLKRRPETLRRMSDGKRGIAVPIEKRLKPEIVEKIAAQNRGVKNPNKGRKRTFTLVSPNGMVVHGVGLRKFCRDNGLSPGGLCLVLSGKIKSCRGWKTLEAVIDRKIVDNGGVVATAVEIQSG